MRIEGRTIIYDNLIDSRTGKPITCEIGPEEDIELVRKGLDKISRSAREAGENLRRMFGK